MAKTAFPELLSVSVCAVLVVPICWLGNVKVVGARITLAPIAAPLRLIL
jgi:hypothetical protein